MKPAFRRFRLNAAFCRPTLEQYLRIDVIFPDGLGTVNTMMGQHLEDSSWPTTVLLDDVRGNRQQIQLFDETRVRRPVHITIASEAKGDMAVHSSAA